MDLDPRVDRANPGDFRPFGIEVSAVRTAWHRREPFHVAAVALLYEEAVGTEVPPVQGCIITRSLLGAIGFL
jgi:hypothetical protein